MFAILRSPAGRFRIVALAEAVSWAGLLIGMYFKHGTPGNEVGVQVFGPIHGVLVLLYIATAVVTWQVMRWSTAVGIVALLASIPPFGTVVFERWATRAGRLQDPPAGDVAAGRT